MANKIRDTLQLIQSAARNNKYKILYPLMGEEIDILCHASTNPGREIGVAEVYLKGRKYQMAGDMNDEGTWSITIYNTEDFLVRNFFLQVIAGIQNFNAPPTISESTGSYEEFLAEIGFNDTSDTYDKISSMYNQMTTNWYSVRQSIDNYKNMVNNGIYTTDTSRFTSGAYRNVFYGNRNYQSQPWYMSDVKVQQLDHNDEPVGVTTLNNCFVTNVGPIDYSDEIGNVSTTEITFAYSGHEYGEDGSYLLF